LLADRMASVGTLAAGVAHELNNPLAYVLNNLKLSREELDRELDPARLELIRMQLDEAGHGARRMRDILRDLKTFARGDDVAEPIVDVNEVLASCISMCWNEIRHRARLEKKLGDVPLVRVDESRMGQVILNLLINAAQSVDEGHASENRIEVSTFVEGEFVVITVSDTGRGIPAENMSRIFDPFFTTKPAQEGSGLGLSICQNIVTRAGGRIDVESVVGEGSIFRVRVPSARIRKSQAPAEDVAPPLRVEPGVAQVLVVDDEELVGRSIRRALRHHDVQVVTTGRDAIRLLCAQPPPPIDIVFCDLMMPEVSGMDVFDAVQRDAPSMAERFVFMTGGAFTPRARRFLDQVSNLCLEKPFDLGAVRELAQRAVQSASSS
ncbi:MAG: ATP-binding protein, partial [Myxococcota bacterium]